MDLMSKVLKSQLDRFVVLFIDDILVYFPDEEIGVVHLREVLEILRNEKLYAKFSKCKLWLMSVAFLRHVILAECVSVDPKKIKTVVNWS